MTSKDTIHPWSGDFHRRPCGKDPVKVQLKLVFLLIPCYFTADYTNLQKGGSGMIQKKRLFLAGAFLFAGMVTLFAAPGQQTYRNASGKTVGTARQVGGTTYYRDASGKTTGSARTVGGTTYYKDSSGRTTTTARQIGNTTYYRDSSGKTVGTALQVGGTTYYRDASGRHIGTARQTGNTTYYRDSSGRTAGTSQGTGVIAPATPLNKK